MLHEIFAKPITDDDPSNDDDYDDDDISASDEISKGIYVLKDELRKKTIKIRKRGKTQKNNSISWP